MTYILCKNIALRSWWRVPYAYYIKGVRDAQRLTKEEFAFLSLCDGHTELEDRALAECLVQKGMISPCEKGEKSLSPWQKMDCDNRYFPAMNWMITGKCNYNCLHCFNASDNSPLMAEFSLDKAEKLLDEAHITANKNTIPNDPKSPFVTSGIRVGTAAATTRGMGEAEMEKIADFITLCIKDFEGNADAVRAGVNEICERFPLYK